MISIIQLRDQHSEVDRRAPLIKPRMEIDSAPSSSKCRNRECCLCSSTTLSCTATSARSCSSRRCRSRRLWTLRALRRRQGERTERLNDRARRLKVLVVRRRRRKVEARVCVLAKSSVVGGWRGRVSIVITNPCEQTHCSHLAFVPSCMVRVDGCIFILGPHLTHHHRKHRAYD